MCFSINISPFLVSWVEWGCNCLPLHLSCAIFGQSGVGIKLVIRASSGNFDPPEDLTPPYVHPARQMLI